MTIKLNQPEEIEMYRLLAVRKALELETLGLKGRGQVFKLAKEIVESFGVKPANTKVKVLAQLKELY